MPPTGDRRTRDARKTTDGLARRTRSYRSGDQTTRKRCACVRVTGAAGGPRRTVAESGTGMGSTGRGEAPDGAGAADLRTRGAPRGHSGGAPLLLRHHRRTVRQHLCPSGTDRRETADRDLGDATWRQTQGPPRDEPGDAGATVSLAAARSYP